MESFTGFGQAELSPWVLLTASAAYSAALIILSMFFAFRKRIRKFAFWVPFGILTWISVLLGGGQHLPILDQFTSDQYCFGEPGVEVFVALLLPVLAVGWVAWGARRDQERSPQTAA